jgi:hypothetical protein
VESNWVHSALRPTIGLLCQPRVIMMMEKLVDWWLAGEIEILRENPPQCCFVHHKLHTRARTRTWASVVGSQRLTASTMERPVLTTFLQGLIFDSEAGGNMFLRNICQFLLDTSVERERRLPFICCIWGSHVDDCENFGLWRFNTVYRDSFLLA